MDVWKIHYSPQNNSGKAVTVNIADNNLYNYDDNANYYHHNHHNTEDNYDLNENDESERDTKM